jgi:hypothetical protein
MVKNESNGTEISLKAAVIAASHIGLENRRWATILEFESLRFRHIYTKKP